MGLASYANEKYFSDIKSNVFDKIIEFDNKTGLQVTSKSTRNILPMLLNAIKGQRFDNVAGALQKCTEDIVIKIFDHWTKKFPKHKIIFTGGVVMNVKINLTLHSIYGDKIRFMPSGGDESLPIGALAKDNYEGRLKTPHLLFFGPEYPSSEIIEHFKNKRFELLYDNALDKAARLLADGEIVARFSGRGEWGARSLGNRAVLADPSKMESFYLVNDYIKVRDFWMPFAPTILDTDVKRYLQFSSKYAPYMINAMKTTDLGSHHLRAAKHQKDSTVRAQILHKQDSKGYYKLIKKFKEITGIGALLNTSLNIHGEPLATTPEQLKNTVQNSMLKYVLVNDEFLIVKK
jgi:carbamoyltransferase